MEDQQPQLTKQERRELRRQEKERERSRMIRRKTMRRVFIWALIVLGISGGIFGIAQLIPQSSHNQTEFDVTQECVTHGRLGMHIHPNLSIFINGEKQDIPANTGIVSAACFRPIHTHDASGELHIEFKIVKDFTLREFFKIWDKPFNQEQIFDYMVDEEHILTVTVNGALNKEYENLVLRDNDQIIIKYEAKR
ncbi:hypothetical protein MYX07_06310 [Patescibacteria group bacterium AH-259-L07]|nr:hypothetical protein [Patescibacteria group bacterium AH-259-L07]